MSLDGASYHECDGKKVFMFWCLALGSWDPVDEWLKVHLLIAYPSIQVIITADRASACCGSGSVTIINQISEEFIFHNFNIITS